MAGALQIRTERIDDLPVLLAQMDAAGLPEVIDAAVKPHGNRSGLSVGWLSTAWLGFILSEADHRMNEVEPWAEAQRESLRVLLPQSAGVKDFTDDRLADVLRHLSDDEAWQQIETDLGRRLIRVYRLGRAPVRLDSTTVTVYHDPGREDRTLFALGHSKDHRPDLPQLKVMLASLDPLGLPLATLVVAGSEADDGLYVPALERARTVLGEGPHLFVGDCKMAARTTRGFIAAAGDRYLMPLPLGKEARQLLDQEVRRVFSKEQPVERVYRLQEGPSDGETAQTKPARLLALGFETTRRQQARVHGQTIPWQERVLVVYSLWLARQARRGLADRLRKAQEQIRALTPPPGPGRRQFRYLLPLKKAATALLRKHRVQGLLEVSYAQEWRERTVRGYGRRSSRTEATFRYVVTVSRNEAAIAAARRTLGWRLYVTNAPSEELSLAQAVSVYRDAHRIEHDFSRLKGKPLGLRPLYVQRDDHAKGMVRLLSLALRVLTLMEYVVRRALAAGGQELAGLYAGNPKRKTARPTSEQLQRAFRGVTLTIAETPAGPLRHVTPLSNLQRQLLGLLGLEETVYEHLPNLLAT